MNHKFLLLLLLLLTQNLEGQETIEVLYDRVSVTMVDPNVVEELAVYRGSYSLQELDGQVAMIGQLDKIELGLRFSPLVDFNLNTTYTCLYRNEVYTFKLDLEAEYDFLKIRDTYPSSPELPANLLKIYVRFNKPISTTNLQDKIKLQTAEGRPIDRSFLPMENALINEDGTLLTLWIEPGRQKRGLGPNSHLGSVLHNGDDIILFISKDITDRNGISMSEDYQRKMKIVAEDRVKPDFTNWNIISPNPESKEVLKIRFDESLDFASAKKSFSIMFNDKMDVFGSWEMGPSERSVLFYPNERWAKGAYWVHISPDLEDLAANNLVRLFDSDVRKQQDDYSGLLSLKFNIE